MCQTKKYYRMSQKKLELGKPVQGTGALPLGADLEDLLEQQRPDECISRTDCVFFSDNEDPKSTACAMITCVFMSLSRSAQCRNAIIIGLANFKFVIIRRLGGGRTLVSPV
jgi:hypothetical protein